MKKILSIFIYLNIYTCSFFGIYAQELSLSLKAEKPISKGIKDSLQMQKTFADFPTLKKETDTIHQKLQRMGFIDSELLLLQKENDSCYSANFFLGKKYSEIKIFYSKDHFGKKELQLVSSEITDEYFMLPFETIPLSLRKLTSLRNLRGNAFARIKLTGFEKDETNGLSATLFVEDGNIRTIDSIAIKGYEKFPRSFLKYYAGVKKGKVFNQKKIGRTKRKLKQFGVCKFNKTAGSAFQKRLNHRLFLFGKTEQ